MDLIELVNNKIDSNVIDSPLNDKYLLLTIEGNKAIQKESYEQAVEANKNASTVIG